MRNTLIVLSIFLCSFNGLSQIDSKHLEVGEQAPEIAGMDQFGNQVSSTQILQENKILLMFYRGNWCPYCRKHLAKLQENLEALTNKGYHVIVVSPEKPEKTDETSKKIKASFSIIHDKDNAIMNAYKVAFEVNNENVSSYFGYTKKKVANYNVANNNTLPVPATYIISKDRKISFVHYDPDYTKRFDIEAILAM